MTRPASALGCLTANENLREKYRGHCGAGYTWLIAKVRQYRDCVAAGVVTSGVAPAR